MGALETAVDCVQELLRRRRGEELSEEEKKFLLKSREGWPEELIEGFVMYQDLYDWIRDGFFECAADGYEFVPESRIKEKFGRSLQENYPSASPAFMRFAKTFWTIKLVQMDLRNYHDLAIFKLLSKLELDISSVFFPTSGPPNLAITAKEREEAQRRLILGSGANIDVDEFISGNPILRYYKSSQSGCLGLLIMITIFVVGIWILL